MGRTSTTQLKPSPSTGAGVAGAGVIGAGVVGAGVVGAGVSAVESVSPTQQWNGFAGRSRGQEKAQRFGDF